jgi:hypothetical protein
MASQQENASMTNRLKLLPLSVDQLTTLGEIVALHGYIAHELAKTVVWLTVPRGNTGNLDVIKYKSLRADTEVWKTFALEHLTQPQLAPDVCSLSDRLLKNIRDRNDFVHAVFQEQLSDGGYVGGPYSMGSFGSPVAVRQGPTQDAKPAHELALVRDEAEAIAKDLTNLNWTIIGPHLPPLFSSGAE